MKTVAILGSTGSIGRNTLKVISQLQGELKVVALATGTNAHLLAKQIEEFHPRLAAIMDKTRLPTIKESICSGRSSTKDECLRLLAGQEGIDAVATCGADIVVMAIGATAALLPTLKALETSQRVALANKECLVMAGDIVMQRARESKSELIPIDSEHNAIFQCLKDEANEKVEKIYLTGSGGPLNDIDARALEFVEPDFALRHPHWQMGKKISIDSATLMNKGFEVIEAQHLFDFAPTRIEVLIHPQAVVHSLVQFVDGSILAQLGIADMRIPIQYALTYPQRMPARLSRLDFSKIEKLSFRLPDLNKFPCLGLAMQVARQKGLAGTVLNACDEECVEAYLAGKIKIVDFARIIESVLADLQNKDDPSLGEILEADHWAREQIKSQLGDGSV